MRVWARATTAGVLFGAFTLVSAAFANHHLTGDQWALAVGSAVIFGVVFGLIQVPANRSAQRRLFGATLTSEERAAAVAAVRHAEPPRDPRLRAAADKVARSWDRGGSNSPLGVAALFAALLVAAVVGALLLDRGMWAVVILGAVVAPWLTVQTYLNRRNARRYLGRPDPA